MNVLRKAGRVCWKEIAVGFAPLWIMLILLVAIGAFAHRMIVVLPAQRVAAKEKADQERYVQNQVRHAAALDAEVDAYVRATVDRMWAPQDIRDTLHVPELSKMARKRLVQRSGDLTEFYKAKSKELEAVELVDEKEYYRRYSAFRRKHAWYFATSDQATMEEVLSLDHEEMAWLSVQADKHTDRWKKWVDDNCETTFGFLPDAKLQIRLVRFGGQLMYAVNGANYTAVNEPLLALVNAVAEKPVSGGIWIPGDQDVKLDSTEGWFTAYDYDRKAKRWGRSCGGIVYDISELHNVRSIPICVQVSDDAVRVSFGVFDRLPREEETRKKIRYALDALAASVGVTIDPKAEWEQVVNSTWHLKVPK